MGSFRTGLPASRQRSNPFAGLSLDERRELCMDVLTEVGANNIQERANHELYHSCVLPFGNHPHGDRNPSASVNYEKMVAGCFVCGNGGWLWWVAAVKGLDSSAEARQWVASQVADEQIDDLTSILEFLDSLYQPRPYEPITYPVYDPKTLDQWMLIHPYLTEWRNVPRQNIVDLKVGYGTLSVRKGEGFVKSERIIIPHFFRGQLVGWQSRRLTDDGTPKYLATPDMPKDSTLYNYDEGHEVVVVVESPMTVLRHTHHAHLVGTFGASVTDQQVDLIARSGKRVILWFDNDKAGWAATESVGERLLERVVVWVADSPFEGDPGDLTDDQFDRVLREHVIPFAIWSRPDPGGLLSLEGGRDGHQEVRSGEGHR